MQHTPHDRPSGVTPLAHGAIESQFRRLLEKMPAGAYTCDAEGLINYFNPQAERLWGRAPKLNDPADRYCGSFQLFSIGGSPISHNQCWMADALRTGNEYNGEEIVIERPDGSRITVLAHASPIRDETGKIVGAVSVLVDISDRKRAEEAQGVLAAIVESSQDAIVSKTLDGRIISWNRGAERIFGYTAQEAVGSHITMIIPPERRDEEHAILQRLRRGDRIEPFDTVRVTKNGHRIDISLTISPVRDSQGRIIGASKVARDVTARKQADAVLRDSEQRFAKFMQHLPGLAWIKDLQGRYLFVNDAAEQAFRKLRAELHGKTDDEIFPPQTARQFRENDRKALAEGVAVETIETLQHADGVHHSLVTKFPIPGPDGAPVLIGGMAIDITERIKAEESLREADHRKDEFLAMLAHELRNPLAPISNSLHLLRLSDDFTPTTARVLDVMEEQVDQMIRLVDDLMEVSRITRGKIRLRLAPVELAAVVRSAIETSRPLIDAAGHQFAVALPPMPLTLEADPVRLAQVITNLLNNAAKYTDAGGQIWLTAREENGEAVISVRDTGAGIPPEMLPRIFDMFTQADRTVSRAQGGLGIGLTLAKRLVQSHGGTIRARSDGPGKGSEFIIRLPLARERRPSRGRGAPAKSSQVALPSRRILVVDDARAAGYILGKLLERLGQQVRTSHDAMTALDYARFEPPDVLISDIAMPEVDGYELARRFRQDPRLSGVVLVALTGYGQDKDRQRAKEAGFDHHLVKPASLDALRDLLASLPKPKQKKHPDRDTRQS